MAWSRQPRPHDEAGAGIDWRPKIGWRIGKRKAARAKGCRSDLGGQRGSETAFCGVRLAASNRGHRPEGHMPPRPIDQRPIEPQHHGPARSGQPHPSHLGRSPSLDRLIRTAQSGSKVCGRGLSLSPQLFGLLGRSPLGVPPLGCATSRLNNLAAARRRA